MKKLILVVVCCIAALNLSAQDYNGAHIKMDTAEHNFGDVARRGGDLTYTFEFENDGSTPLVITRIITSCSCLKTTYSKRPISPGQKSVIKITYEIHKKEPGTFSKIIQVYSNSVDGRQILTIQGNSINTKEL